MRKIKFRQRHKIGKAESWWHWGFLEGHGFVAPLSNTEVNYQFTGLHDKNGKEIWEGDIVRYRYDEMEDWRTAKVGWGGDYPAFEISPNPFDESNGLMTIVIDWHCEVLGNIYENPELLEGTK